MVLTRRLIMAAALCFAMVCGWPQCLVDIWGFACSVNSFNSAENLVSAVEVVLMAAWPVLLFVLGWRIRATRRSLASTMWRICACDVVRWGVVVANTIVYWACVAPPASFSWEPSPVREVVFKLFVQCPPSLMIGVLLWYWWPVLRAKGRPLAGGEGPVCFECGYDLRGNTTGVCPECGTPTEATAADRAVGASK
jgi:hypothetical protein